MAVLLSTTQTDETQESQMAGAFDNHEYVISLRDSKSGLRAFVAVHNTNLGSALGGTRMAFYKNDDDALQDVLNLSKAMSYKCAMANLPFGGGKAVIVADSSRNRDQILLTYASRIEKLNGLFKTGTDVGIADEDVKNMATKTSHMLGVTEADRGDLSTSKTAALGVFYAMKSALYQIYGSDNFKNKKIAIKGVGKLGAELARLVLQAGASVSIADIDESKCQVLLADWRNLTVVPVSDIHKQVVDIYAPCALGSEFSATTVRELKCKAVVGGANNQLMQDKAGDLLSQRNILYAPDYVANAGGLIYVADELEPGGFNKNRVIARTQAIEKTMNTIFEKSLHEKVPPYRVADMLARARINGKDDA